MITLELSYPPSTNHYKTLGRLTTTKIGKVYQQRRNSPATKRFYWEAWTKILALKAREGLSIPLQSTIALEVHVDLYPPDKRRRDIDNSLKVLLDSLQRGGLIEDDSQIHRLVVEKKSIIPQGKVIVRIEELQPCT